MIHELMKSFNKCWKYSQTMPVDYLIEDTGECYRIIIKNTCDWYCDGGGCTMCNYSDRTGVKATEIIRINEHKIYTEITQINKGYKKLKFYINGSFFNNNELNVDIAIKFINNIKNITGITHISVETRPEYMNLDILRYYIEKTGLKFELCFGIESTNDIVRNSCLNKGINKTSFYNIAKEIEHYCDIKVYLLIKPPFLSEEQAINDVVHSVNELIINNITCISYTPIAIQTNTLIEFLLQEDLYRPVWLWSLIEINTRLKAIKKEYPNIHLSGLDYYPHPLLASFNCENCTKYIFDMLLKNRDLTWDDIIESDLCDCYQKWKKELNDNIPLSSIEKKVVKASSIFKNNIIRINEIYSRLNEPTKDIWITDIAKTVPEHKIVLDDVGVENYKMPLRIDGYPDSVATCSYSQSLNEFHRGIHMSRLIEQLNVFSNYTHKDIISDLEELLHNSIGHSSNRKINMSFSLFKTSQTELSKKDNYSCITVNVEVSYICGKLHNCIELVVPFINACPCTLVTAIELFNKSFSHTQRGTINLTFVDIDDEFSAFVNFAEKYIGIYDLLKREDEINVVKSAFEHAEFCEDICRNLSQKIIKQFMGKADKAYIKVTTNESIHPHDAFSKKSVSLRDSSINKYTID